MFTERTYKLTFEEKILGGAPMNRETYKKYITGDNVDADEEIQTIAEDDSLTTGFHKDDGGVFFYDYVVKGFLKEAGNVVKDIVGIKALRSKIDNYLFVFPRRIYLAREVTGVLERPLRGMTAQGPRVTIARSEYIDPPVSIMITVKLMKHKELTIEIIEKLLAYGEYKGLGQWRNGGYGKFKCEEASNGQKRKKFQVS